MMHEFLDKALEVVPDGTAFAVGLADWLLRNRDKMEFVHPTAKEDIYEIAESLFRIGGVAE